MSLYNRIDGFLASSLPYYNVYDKTVIVLMFLLYQFVFISECLVSSLHYMHTNYADCGI